MLKAGGGNVEFPVMNNNDLDNVVNKEPNEEEHTIDEMTPTTIANNESSVSSLQTWEQISKHHLTSLTIITLNLVTFDFQNLDLRSTILFYLVDHSNLTIEQEFL